WQRVADRAGVPDVTFHDLRRHVGTQLINAGERLEVVSKLLGHQTVAVTQRSYAHLATAATASAFERLAVAFSLPSGEVGDGESAEKKPRKKRASRFRKP